MKRGGLGGALLLAALAMVAVLLLLDRAHPTDRAPRKAISAPAVAVQPPAPAPVSATAETSPPPNEPPRSTRGGARLVGRVTDDEGHPIADAGIWLTKGRGGLGPSDGPRPGSPGEGEIVARTAEDGRYLVDGVDGVDGEERMVGAIAAHHAPSDLQRIEPATQTVFEIDFALRRGGGTLALAFGDAEAVDVFIEPVFLESPDSGGRRHVEVRGKSNVLVDGLAPEWSFLRVRAAGYAPQTLLTRVPPEGVTETRVPLGQGTVVFGIVHAASGAPASGARVDIVGWEWAEIGVVADAAGAYRMERAPASLVELRAVDAGGAEARTLVRLEEGGEYPWDPVLQAPADIAGRVVDESGAPVAQASVSCWTVGASRAYDSLDVDALGRFRFGALPNREYRIAAWWPGWFEKVPPAAEVTVTPGGPPITITLPRTEGFLRGVITTRSGLPAAGATVRTWPSGSPNREVRVRAAADGVFRLGPLPPGNYFLELHLDGEPTLHRDGIEVKASETNDLGVLRFAAGGRIRARVVDSSGVPAATEQDPVVRSLDTTVTFVVARDAEAVVSEELVPGRYLVSGGMAGIIEEAEAVAGETTNVDLKLRGGGILEAVALREDGSRTMADFEITDSRGHRIAISDGPVNPLTVQLASGWYTVTATDGTGARGSRQVQIPADGSETQIPLALGMPVDRR